jgi:hypothetical protein
MERNMSKKKNTKRAGVKCKTLPIKKDNIKFFYEFLTNNPGVPLGKKPMCTNHIFLAAASGSPSGWDFIELVEPLLNPQEDAVFCLHENLTGEALIGFNGNTIHMTFNITPKEVESLANEAKNILTKEASNAKTAEKASAKKGAKGWKVEKTNNEYLGKYAKKAKGTGTLLYKHLKAHSVFYDAPYLEEAAKTLRGAMNLERKMSIAHETHAVALIRKKGEVSTLFVSQKKGKEVAKIYFTLPGTSQGATKTINSLIPQIQSFVGKAA